MTYYFGIYHWRKHLRPMAIVAITAVLAGIASLRASLDRRIAGLGAIAAGVYGVKTADELLRPRPWSVSRSKYDALVELLPPAEGRRLLDVGSGTGRSLVGLAPSLRDARAITAVDRFDSSIILGNGPALARRNAAIAGLDASVITGDATALPVATDSQDVVTICLVLHDLSERDVRRVLAELHRVCDPDGTVGVIELPIIDDSRFVTTDYWPDVVVDSGFDVQEVRTLPWKDDRSYTVLTATPTGRTPSDSADGASSSRR